MIKKLEKRQKSLVNEFEAVRDNIAANPFIGEELTQDLKGYWKYGWKYKSVDLRIMYRLDELDNHIYFVFFGTRENFYEDAKNHLKG